MSTCRKGTGRTPISARSAVGTGLRMLDGHILFVLACDYFTLFKMLLGNLCLYLN